MKFVKTTYTWLSTAIAGLVASLGCSGCLFIIGFLFPPLWLLIPFIFIGGLLATPGALKKREEKRKQKLLEKENKVLLNQFLKDNSNKS